MAGGRTATRTATTATVGAELQSECPPQDLDQISSCPQVLIADAHEDAMDALMMCGTGTTKRVRKRKKKEETLPAALGKF